MGSKRSASAHLPHSKNAADTISPPTPGDAFPAGLPARAVSGARGTLRPWH
jgi:hypothetical protein